MNYTKVIVGYFQLVGVCPYLTDVNLFVQDFLVVLSALHIFLLSSISYLVFHNREIIFFANDAIGYITDVGQLVFLYFSHFVIIFEALHTKSKRRQMWRTLCRVDRRLLQIGRGSTAEHFRRSNHRYLRKAVGTYFFILSVEIFIMSSIIDTGDWLMHWITSIYSYVICRSGLLFYIFLIDRLRARMEVIGNELDAMNGRWYSGWGGGGDGVVGGDQRKQLVVQLKGAYNDLWFVCEMLNASFGWSQMTNVLAYFMKSSVSMYWNYASFYFGTSSYLLETLLETVPAMVMLFVLCYSCDGCLRAVSNVKKKKYYLVLIIIIII